MFLIFSEVFKRTTDEVVQVFNRKHLKADFEVVTLNDDMGFKVISKRWIVERSISWLMRSRMLDKDYETNMESNEAWVHVVSIAIMIKNF